MHVSDAIRTKRALREFTDEPLSDAVITAILDAGRRSPSGGNTQPWHFIAIRHRDTLHALSQLGTWAGHLATAPLGIVIVTPVDPSGWNMFDAGQAAAYMQLAGWELGIGSCIAGIFEREQSLMLLGVPDGLEIQIAISFGYPVPSMSQPRPQHAHGGRRSLDEVVHWERW